MGNQMDSLEEYVSKQMTRINEILQSLNCLAMDLNRRVRLLEAFHNRRKKE